MTDESSPFDWSPYQQAWLDWNSALMPRERRRVPARVAVEWVESPNGGAIAHPSPLWNRDKSRHWIESLLSVPPASGSGGILGDLGAELEGPPWHNPEPELKSIMPWPAWLRPAAPESLFAGPRAPSPAPLIPPSMPMSGAGGPYAAPISEPEMPVQAPQDNPWLGRATASSQQRGLEASVPRMEHLESAKHSGAEPSPASGERMPGNDPYLSPVPQAPSWDQVPSVPTSGAHGWYTGPTAEPAQSAPPTDRDPFALAAARVRQSVRPQGGRMEGLATKLPERAVGDVAYSLATLPQRALAAADRFHRTGEYDPAPIVEAATLMVGAPLTPRGALGSSAQRLPMDRAAVEARMRQMNMAKEPSIAPRAAC